MRSTGHERLAGRGLASQYVRGAARKEMKNTIESKLDDDVKQMVKEAVEKLLGATIADIEEEVREEIGVPEGSGYYEALTQFLDGCPPEYWRDWISDKATQLEEAHIKDNKSLVSDFLSQHLNKGNKKDDNNRNV